MFRSRLRAIVMVLIMGASIAIAYLWDRHERQEQPLQIGESLPSLPDSERRTALPLATRPPNRVTNINGGQPATYAAFLEEKDCYERQNGRPAIEEEMDDLRLSIANAKPTARPAFEASLRQRERQLIEITACLMGRESITKKTLNLLLANAARSGDPDAQVSYAKDPQIDLSYAASDLSELREWRDNALHYLESAVNAGNLDATLAIAEAADPFHCGASSESVCSDLLTSLTGEDAEKAFTYYYLAQIAHSGAAPPWVEQELAALEKVLSAAEVVNAKARAESLRAAH